MSVLSFHGKHLIDKNLKLLTLNHGALISEFARKMCLYLIHESDSKCTVIVI